MSSSILFQPFPFSWPKGKPITDGLAAILGGMANNAIQLSQIVRDPKNNELSVFPQYVVVLSAIKDSKLDTKWTNPFRSSEVIEDSIVHAEIINSIWNYMCKLQQEIISINSSDKEGLKKMRSRIADLTAAGEEFRLYADDDQPVFTPRFAEFIIKYHLYINSAWQYAVILDSQLPVPQQIKTMILCSQQIEQCKAICPELPSIISSFYEPICTSISAYYLANIRLMMGNIDKEHTEVGYSIASYRLGFEIISKVENIVPYALQITTAVACLKKALQSTLANEEKRNKEIFHVYKIPEAPPLGTPIKFLVIDPTENLFGHARNSTPAEVYQDLPTFDDETPKNNKNNNNNTPKPPPPPPNNGGGGVTSPSSFLNSADFEIPQIPTGNPPGYRQSPPPQSNDLPPWMRPGAVAPEAPKASPPWAQNPPAQPPANQGGVPPWMKQEEPPSAPSGGVPPWMQQPPSSQATPPWAQNQPNQQNPNLNAVPPCMMQPQSQPEQPKSAPWTDRGVSIQKSPSAFMEWTNLMAKKQKLLGVMQKLVENPKCSVEIQRLLNNYAQADQSDGLIQQIVNAHNAGDRSRSEQEIRGLIAQADTFYTALEGRVAQYQ